MILTELNQGVLTITLHRPEKKNALSQQMYRDLVQALQRAEADSGIKVVLLASSSDSFCAGNDLQDFLGAGELNDQHPTVIFLYQLARFTKPLIAAVDGLAIGIGTTALLHCDLVYVTERVRFQLPFTALGLCPEAGSSVLLPQVAGYQKAAQYLLLGEDFGANEALQMGLVNQVINADKLMTLATGKAQTLAQLPDAAVLATKKLLRQQLQQPTLAAIAKELELFQQLLVSDDCQQRVKGFFGTKNNKS
ncbi:enoyl-CoA hydratase-related protein [Rheinheimera sp. MMS21-TC3]|uniref:enoyl-CoA hydratase-related protein n=1 Tax=Rheinheimera sp. MMS21-TC3 TaxID=3072790 RepID=UPI0028C4FE39|nr:enoyl-CoA hydratase-related protein [Rheinheimera sp. MMS21-TC3]WNO60745.1 enoyl-CoA hydratase-related protein [Rheinheimera sp. MMS21-TC3]